MIATKILITWRYSLPLPSRINNQLRRGPSQTPSLILLWGKIIVWDSFTFNHSRKREWKKCEALQDQCVCVYTSLSGWFWHCHQLDSVLNRDRKHQGGTRVGCEWWKSDLHMQAAHKHRARLEGESPTVVPGMDLSGCSLFSDGGNGKHRQGHTVTTSHILWGKSALFSTFWKLSNCFVYASISNMKACVHPDNQSWSLAGRGKIDLLCLGDTVWFSSSLFFFL